MGTIFDILKGGIGKKKDPIQFDQPKTDWTMIVGVLIVVAFIVALATIAKK